MDTESEFANPFIGAHVVLLANDSFREVMKCTEIYIIPTECAKTFKLLFMALALNGHYAAAATAPRGKKRGGDKAKHAGGETQVEHVAFLQDDCVYGLLRQHL